MPMWGSPPELRPASSSSTLTRGTAVTQASRNCEANCQTGFTRVTARRIAQLPKATFVTRLQPARLPARGARQLPDQSTTLRAESSSTSDARLRGALPRTDFGLRRTRHRAARPIFALRAARCAAHHRETSVAARALGGEPGKQNLEDHWGSPAAARRRSLFLSSNSPLAAHGLSLPSMPWAS
jgi:hypothetical protein